MVNGISSGATSDTGAITQTAAVQPAQPATATQSTTQAADSVKLSAAAEAHAMQQQGMNVKTIAANMGISTQAVDSYLGLTSGGSGGAGNGNATLQSIAAKVRVNGPSGSAVY